MNNEPAIDNLRKSLTLVSETLPFLIVQAGVLLGFTLITALWISAFYWLAGLIHNSFGQLIIYAFALGVPAVAFRIIRQYVLYMIKAAHVAVLTRLILNEPVSSIGMIAYGKNQIQQQFARMNVFFLVDELVNNVVNCLNYFIETIMPLPKESTSRKFVQTVIRASTTNIDEAILSYNLSRPMEDVWLSARDGLVLYAQNYQSFLKKALQFVIIEWALTYIPVLIMIISFLTVRNPSNFAVASTVVMVGMWMLVLRHVLFQPLLMTMILLSFHSIARTQQPDEEWQNKLNQISDAFRAICDKATEGEVFQQASGFGK
jgi:hypothetical protein